MADQDLRKWTTFFKDAGVPLGPAVEYAGLFCDHRIKEDLLGDLTKDILNDIGISVMGDIMSILKHSRAVYAKLEREKASNRLFPQLQAKADSEISSGPQIKKKTIQKNVIKPKLSGIQKANGVPVTANKTPKVGNVKTVMDNHVPTVPQKRPMTSNLTLSERFAGESIVPPKVSRESTEIAGNNLNLKMKMPVRKTKSVSNPVEPQIVPGSQGGVKTAPKRKSAFERLGKEAPAAEKMPKMQTSNVTKPVQSLVPVQAPFSSSGTFVTKGESSVFKRLGETEPKSTANTAMTLTTRTVTGLGSPVTGLGSRKVSDDSRKRNLHTHQLLQPLKPTKAVKPVRSVSPVNNTTKLLISADRNSSPEKPKVKKSVFSRLGSQT